MYFTEWYSESHSLNEFLRFALMRPTNQSNGWKWNFPWKQSKYQTEKNNVS